MLVCFYIGKLDTIDTTREEDREEYPQNVVAVTKVIATLLCYVHVRSQDSFNSTRAVSPVSQLVPRCA